VHTLDLALNLYPDNPYALMNRAIANLQNGKLDAAQSDYETLERILPKPLHTVYYGLGEVFYQKKNSKMALQYYNQYLKLAPRGTPEVKFVQERISKLKNGSI